MDRIKLPPFSNVKAGGLATLSTTALNGMSVHAFVFVCSGTTFDKGNISSFRLTMNGKKLITDISGTQLQTLNSQKGLQDNPGVLMFYQGNPRARTIKGQHITDLDLSVYRSPLEFQIQIDGAAVDPQLDCYALVNPPKIGMGLGYTPDDAAVIRASLRSVLNPANAVNKAAYDIAIGSAAGAAIEQIGLFNAALKSLEIKKSGVIIFEDLDKDLNAAIQSDFGRASQAGLYVWSPTFDRNMGHAVTTVKPDGTPYALQFLVTTSAADTIEVYSEVATKLGLI